MCKNLKVFSMTKLKLVSLTKTFYNNIFFFLGNIICSYKPQPSEIKLLPSPDP